MAPYIFKPTISLLLLNIFSYKKKLFTTMETVKSEDIFTTCCIVAK